MKSFEHSQVNKRLGSPTFRKFFRELSKCRDLIERVFGSSVGKLYSSSSFYHGVVEGQKPTHPRIQHPWHDLNILLISFKWKGNHEKERPTISVDRLYSPGYEKSDVVNLQDESWRGRTDTVNRTYFGGNRQIDTRQKRNCDGITYT